MPALSPADMQFFGEQGYVVLHHAVPRENLEATIDALWRFAGVDPEDREHWYSPPLQPNGVVNLFQHQSIWDNRQDPRIYEAFSQLWGMKELWVSLDRTCLKLPETDRHPDWVPPSFIHWDVDFDEGPVQFGAQGVLCLTDTDDRQGGFQCIPGAHHAAVEWSLRDHPAGATPQIDVDRVDVIPAKAGDLIIWDRALPHGAGRNLSDRPRLAQYVCLFPAWDDEPSRRSRIAQWQLRQNSPVAPDVPNSLPGETPATLTGLGQRLLGLDPWERPVEPMSFPCRWRRQIEDASHGRSR